MLLRIAGIWYLSAFLVLLHRKSTKDACERLDVQMGSVESENRSLNLNSLLCVQELPCTLNSGFASIALRRPFNNLEQP